MKRTSLVMAGISLVMVASGSVGLRNPSSRTTIAGHHIETLTFWQQWTGGAAGEGPNVTALNMMIKAFEQKYPYVRVKMESAQSDSKILTAIAAGTAPDVIDLSSSEYIAEWASKGALMPLNKFTDQKGFSTRVFVPSGLQAVTVKGKLYGLPFMNFDDALYWNKTEFKQAGLNPNDPPTTIAQLNHDAKILTKFGSNGKITQLGFDNEAGFNGIESFAWLFGGGWFNAKTGKATANSAANIQALTFEQSPYKEFGYSKVNDFIGSLGVGLTAQGPFESGRVAMSFNGIWDEAFIHANVPHLQFGIAPMPAPAGLSRLSGSTYLDTNPQVIPSDAPNPQLAWDFIRFETTQPTLDAKFAALVDNLSQLKDSPTTPWTSTAGYKLFQKLAESSNAHVFPQLAATTEYETDITNAETAVNEGTKSPKQALNLVQQEVESLLK